jgi:hypothetical protein
MIGVNQIELFQRKLEEAPRRHAILPLGERFGPTEEFEIAAMCQTINHLNGYFSEDHVVVEIGALLGQTAVALASISDYKVISIDPHDGPEFTFKTISSSGIPWKVKDRFYGTYERMVENLEFYGLTDKVEIIRDYSYNVEWDGRKICFLFIDGEHTYEAAKKDYELFSPYLSERASIVFHDYDVPQYPGVKRYVDEMIESGKLLRVKQVGSSFFCVEPY